MVGGVTGVEVPLFAEEEELQPVRPRPAREKTTTKPSEIPTRSRLERRLTQRRSNSPAMATGSGARFQGDLPAGAALATPPETCFNRGVVPVVQLPEVVLVVTVRVDVATAPALVIVTGVAERQMLRGEVVDPLVNVKFTIPT